MRALPQLILHGRKEDCLRRRHEMVTTKQFDDVLSCCEFIDFYRADTDGNALQLRIISDSPPQGWREHLAETLVEGGFTNFDIQRGEALEFEASQKLRLTSDVG